MQTVLAREVEQKLHVQALCVDFQQAVMKPNNVAFDYVADGCQTLVVQLQGKATKKAALTQLSADLKRMADQAAALAAALPDDPPVTIDEGNKAVSDLPVSTASEAWPEDIAKPSESVENPAEPKEA